MSLQMFENKKTIVKDCIALISKISTEQVALLSSIPLTFTNKNGRRLQQQTDEAVSVKKIIHASSVDAKI